MPHQCVRCSKFYDDGAKEILQGCSCGARLFFYIKQSKLDALKETKITKLTNEEKVQLESDILDIVGADTESEPVVLDFESIRIATPGKYEIDLVSLFQKNPVVFKLAEGKYIIDIATQ